MGVIHASFQRIIDACCMHASDNVVGEAALCTVNPIEYGKKVQEPFYMVMKDNTRVKYQSVWLQLLSYVVRSETDLAAEDRPGYRLTRQQRDGFATLMNQAAAFHGVEVTDATSREAARQMEALDMQCLRFCIQLLDHRLPGDAYESVIISGLSILGVREGGGWLEAIEYTTNYSAVVKLARALVVEQAYQTRQRQINTAGRWDPATRQPMRTPSPITYRSAGWWTGSWGWRGRARIVNSKALLWRGFGACLSCPFRGRRT